MKASHSLVEALISLLILWMMLNLLQGLSQFQSPPEFMYLYDQMEEGCAITCWLNVHQR